MHYVINISSVVEFQRCWVLKTKIFGQELRYGKKIKKFLQGMSVHQKLDIILENKVVQKLSLEKNVYTKKWSPKLIFLYEIFFWKNSVYFRHQKLTLKVRFWHFLTNPNSLTDFFLIFPLSTLILCKKSWFLGPTILEIPQPK